MFRWLPMLVCLSNPVVAQEPPDPIRMAIEDGLEYLAKEQNADGSWNPDDGVLNAKVAVTGLCLSAFHRAGYSHVKGKHRAVIQRGIAYLIKLQAESGAIYDKDGQDVNSAVRIYTHATALTTICEAIINDSEKDDLRVAAKRAIEFLVKAQHKTRGGWRYTPGLGADTSVTGWVTMALLKAQEAKVEVPKKTLDGVRGWLELAQRSGGTEYCYNPLAPTTKVQRHGRMPTPSCSCIGLLMKLHLDGKSPPILSGVEKITRITPTVGTKKEPKRDAHFWYLAATLMTETGRKAEKKWVAKVHSILMRDQVREKGELYGSWQAKEPTTDRWSLHAGRYYLTAMSIMTLTCAHPSN